ncbi:MAG: DUF3617 domain-containing protein [Pseudomonadales bacterium]|nr:DUF3617 domain-containing protein [Pseudomonadales bacterium]
MATTHPVEKSLLAGLLLVSTQLYSESYDFKPGLWETTSSMEIIEIDAPPPVKKMMRQLSNMPTEIETECIDSIASMFEPDPDDTDECTTKTNRISANKIAFEMLCSGPDGTSRGIGEVNLNGKNFNIPA